MKSLTWNGALRRAAVAMVFISFFAGCAGVQTPSKPAAVPEIRPGLLAGYLPPNALPNNLALIPQPPATGSAAFSVDEELYRQTRAFRGTARWELATQDAELKFPEAARNFSCAIKAPITEKDTPHLYMLMRRTLTDAGLSTYGAKDQYKLTRNTGKGSGFQ